jgi:hypothetical protein
MNPRDRLSGNTFQLPELVTSDPVRATRFVFDEFLCGQEAEGLVFWARNDEDRTLIEENIDVTPKVIINHLFNGHGVRLALKSDTDQMRLILPYQEGVPYECISDFLGAFEGYRTRSSK